MAAQGAGSIHYLKRLERVDAEVLERLVALSWELMNERHA